MLAVRIDLVKIVCVEVFEYDVDDALVFDAEDISELRELALYGLYGGGYRNLALVLATEFIGIG